MQIVLSNYGLPAHIKTLRMILIFQLEISRLMCICWHKFFNRYTYFFVSYIIVISERIRHILFNKTGMRCEIFVEFLLFVNTRIHVHVLLTLVKNKHEIF